MFSRLMSLASATFLISLILSALAAPISVTSEVDPASESTLSTRTTHSGRGTYFYPGLGNCGDWNGDDDSIVAISTQIYKDGGNCNQWVHITNTENGRETYAMVRDSCPSCSAGSLDMSPHTFSELASLDEGVIPISWNYMPKDYSP